MTSKDWIPFKPIHPFPGEEIVALKDNGNVVRFRYSEPVPSSFTHWQPWADPLALDPFEAWFATRYGRAWCDNDNVALRYLREAWDAALAWQKGQS